jgi:alpha-galactosidase
MHRRWWINDPDCLLLRPDTYLTLDEVRSQATVIALTDGVLFLSDDLPNVPPERLRIAQVLVPPIGRSARLMDWFDSLTPRALRLDMRGASGQWYLLALFNWEDAPQDLVLRLSDYDLDLDFDYLVREFWHGEVHFLKDGMLPLEGIPPHAVRLFAVRRHTPELPQYLGSDLHISQGLEVSAWRWHEAGDGTSHGELDLVLERPGSTQGQVEVYLPASPRASTLEGRPITWHARGQGCYRFPVKFERRAELHVICG